MSIIISTRGPQVGVCNICGETGKLTEDHTPPKGCVRIRAVELHHITQRLTTAKPITKGRISQNGVKYRTLCHRCNNALLGLKYDPSFIRFVNNVGAHLISPLTLPRISTIKGKPQRIMRSLIGHLCAQGVDRYLKGAVTKPIKDYFLDETRALPTELNVYFWPFPFKGHAMARDCAYHDISVGDHCLIWFIKFFPVGFMVTFNEPSSYKFELECLSSFRNTSIDSEVDITIDLDSIPSEYWPESPTPNTVLFYGEQAITSYKLKRK